MGEPSRTPIRLLLVEDQRQILRSQLKLLESFPELRVVGSARDGPSALAAISSLRPEVVLLDLGLPGGMDGIEVTRQVRARFPAIEVLIFTVFEEEDKVLQAIRAGASGYLLKGMEAARIVEAILEVHGGGSVIQPHLARRLLRQFQRSPAAGTGTTGPRTGAGSGQPGALASPASPAGKTTTSLAADSTSGPSLSPREREILKYISRGLSNPEVAEALGLSRATVRTHLEHIYAKLEVANRTEAVAEGIRQGIIDV